ncbi:MAG: LysR family transcriptional regulator [Clostridiales bacterium]|nr:LysR family transcriptional regulator [Clostridiales bacterium]
MELRVLRYFLTVAREENITRAAELLHVSQPAVSRQLAQLEDELGVRLFSRSNHHITLTEDGLMLRRRAQEIIDLTDKTQRDFRQHTAELSGEIAIGSGELRSFSTLGAVLAEFSALHPQVRYALFSGNADHIKEKTENGTLDMGLLSMPVDLAKYDFLRFPVAEEYGVLVRADSPLTEKKLLAPKDLADMPLMLPERALVRSELANWFGDLYDRLNIRLTYNLAYNAAMLVRQGMGAALCLRLDCAYDDLTFVPISLTQQTGSALVWKKHQTHSPAVSALIAHVNAAVHKK